VGQDPLGDRRDFDLLHRHFVYLITQVSGMAECNAQQTQAARDELRRVVGFSVADEIGKLDQLKSAGSLVRLRRRVRDVQAKRSEQE
jgi:hypothetical protein